ncbi:hypothetical protein D8674_010183 [Pyrus ussuriensis x Pyrus communis]|uniref:S-protein homolog n=1 Tax=Pyrus ussuriensis x Pyrus communis TaxID=2448454 RepID=A0A5N5FF99_9ROSA|nr:hypothetical protein D8674_010183 [Pyrus ussuriensis x Pyrus communis]
MVYIPHEKMSPCLTNALQFMLLILVVLTTSVEAGLLSKVTIQITNALGPNTDLTVHCKSNDDDLGYHRLHPGDSFAFKFKPNIWGTTLFFCSFEWAGEFHYYDVFRADRDGCGNCYWTIYFLGICSHDHKCIQWQDRAGSKPRPLLP